MNIKTMGLNERWRDNSKMIAWKDGKKGIISSAEFTVSMVNRNPYGIFGAAIISEEKRRCLENVKRDWRNHSVHHRVRVLPN